MMNATRSRTSLETFVTHGHSFEIEIRTSKSILFLIYEHEAEKCPTYKHTRGWKKVKNFVLNTAQITEKKNVSVCLSVQHRR